MSPVVLGALLGGLLGAGCCWSSGGCRFCGGRRWTIGSGRTCAISAGRTCFSAWSTRVRRSTRSCGCSVRRCGPGRCGWSGLLGGAVSIRRRLARAGIDRTVEEFRIEQVLWGAAGFGARAADRAGLVVARLRQPGRAAGARGVPCRDRGAVPRYLPHHSGPSPRTPVAGRACRRWPSCWPCRWQPVKVRPRRSTGWRGRAVASWRSSCNECSRRRARASHWSGRSTPWRTGPGWWRCRGLPTVWRSRSNAVRRWPTYCGPRRAIFVRRAGAS